MKPWRIPITPATTRPNANNYLASVFFCAQFSLGAGSSECFGVCLLGRHMPKRLPKADRLYAAGVFLYIFRASTVGRHTHFLPLSILLWRDCRFCVHCETGATRKARFTTRRVFHQVKRTWHVLTRFHREFLQWLCNCVAPFASFTRLLCIDQGFVFCVTIPASPKVGDGVGKLVVRLLVASIAATDPALKPAASSIR